MVAMQKNNGFTIASVLRFVWVVVLLCQLVTTIQSSIRLISASTATEQVTTEARPAFLVFDWDQYHRWHKFAFKCTKSCKPVCGSLPSIVDWVPKICIDCLHECMPLCDVPWPWIVWPHSSSAPLPSLSSSLGTPRSSEDDADARARYMRVYEKDYHSLIKNGYCVGENHHP